MYTEKQLISKLSQLKQIKPTKSWVFSVKMSILESDAIESKAVVRTNRGWNVSNLFGLFSQRKLAYAFAVLLFAFIGTASFLKYGLPQASNVKVANQSADNSVAQATLQDNVKDFKTKSENLAQVLQSKSSIAPLAIKEVKEAAKTLADTIQKNPQLAKTIALDVNNSKTYLDIPAGSEGDDLKEALNTPYKALVEQLIKDEKEMTLTHDQQMVLDYVVDLHSKGKDSDALVNLVLLVHSTDNPPADSK